MSNSAQFPILNPNTSLAYLPPDIAAQLEVYRYIVVSAAAVRNSPLDSLTLLNIQQINRHMAGRYSLTPVLISDFSFVADLALQR